MEDAALAQLCFVKNIKIDILFFLFDTDSSSQSLDV